LAEIQMFIRKEALGGTMRTGIGYDIHCLAFGRKLVLGGVTIPFSQGLSGHSDADVLVLSIWTA